VKWAEWDKTHSRELLGPFICVCVALCTTVVHNIAQNRPYNFPFYPPDNHHCSDDVYLREGGYGSLKYRTQKIAISAPSDNFSRVASLQLRHIATIGKNLLNSSNSSTCPPNTVNFGPLTAEICWRVWGTPENFNGFRVLAVLLHGTVVVGVSQTLWRWTEGATYIQQGGHHVGHWPTF